MFNPGSRTSSRAMPGMTFGTSCSRRRETLTTCVRIGPLISSTKVFTGKDSSMPLSNSMAQWAWKDRILANPPFKGAVDMDMVANDLLSTLGMSLARKSAKKKNDENGEKKGPSAKTELL